MQRYKKHFINPSSY